MLNNSSFKPKNMRPLYDRILVKKDIVDNKTKGGVILPDSDKEFKTFTGVVIRTSPVKNKDGSFNDSVLKEGDRVCFSKFSGEYFSDEDEFDSTYILLKEIEIFAIIED